MGSNIDAQSGNALNVSEKVPSGAIIMRIKKISLALIFYMALLEAFSLWIQPIIGNFIHFKTEPINAIVYGLLTGFFGMFFAISIYNVLPYKIKINNKKIKRVEPFVPCSFNALFLAIAFAVQVAIQDLNRFSWIGYALFGFISIAIAAIMSILIYNRLKFKIKYSIENKKQQIKRITAEFAVIAGFFEFFIMPPMIIFYYKGVPEFANGFLSGLMGSIIPFIIINMILDKIKLEI